MVKLLPGSDAELAGVRVGWKQKGAPVKEVKSESSGMASVASGTKSTSFRFTFSRLEHFSPFAEEQNWGVSTSRGYQPALGLGKCCSPEYMNWPSLQEVQFWMRNYLA